MNGEMKVDTGAGRQRTVPVDYPANSKRSRENPAKEEKKTEKIVTGNVIQRKKGIFSRAGNSLISEGSDSVLQYIVMDVLIPAAKSTITDVVSQGIERLIYGDRSPRSRSDRPGGYISYNRVRRQTPEYNAISERARSQHDFDSIILATRGEAEDVIDRLRDLISQYEVATVADLYDLVGISGNFTDDKWGWYDLRSAMVRHVRGGYLLSLPRTQPIE